MATVYIVTFGEYSSYEIDRVFSTKEKATAYLGRCSRGYGHPYGRIEEYKLDDVNEDWVAGRVGMWSVVFGKDSADIVFIAQRENDDSGNDEAIHRNEHTGQVTVRLYADTQKRAAKAAMERRAIWLANIEPMITKGAK